MALTLGNWGFLIGMYIALGIIVVIGIAFFDPDDLKKPIIIGLSIVSVIMILTGVGISWYNTNMASGIRAYKDFKSEISNGLDREIIITSEDGREIFHYEGKVDIESNHEDNYIKFEGEDGRRYMIYYGIQDTIQIIEKAR